MTCTKLHPKPRVTGLRAAVRGHCMPSWCCRCGQGTCGMEERCSCCFPPFQRRELTEAALSYLAEHKPLLATGRWFFLSSFLKTHSPCVCEHLHILSYTQSLYLRVKISETFMWPAGCFDEVSARRSSEAPWAVSTLLQLLVALRVSPTLTAARRMHSTAGRLKPRPRDATQHICTGHLCKMHGEFHHMPWLQNKQDTLTLCSMSKFLNNAFFNPERVLSYSGK